jgi:cyclomaltodextrinase / maltogenic alpha-amylase / neopullulanase
MKFFVTIGLIFFISLSISYSQQKNTIHVPSWAKQAVWYQIFPERFYNGDKSNDPQPIDMEGAWPYFIPEDWQIHPWTSDWYKLQPWETKTGKDFYWNAGVRRYGGDLQGVIDKLDYLKELGINTIYLNPIFEAPSLHKYDASFFHHIDNNFGPNAEGDRKIWAEENPGNPSTWKWTAADKLFLKLIDEVHKRGMKIIIDGVFNHTGTQFWAFKDIVKNQQNSIYKNWYTIKKWDNPNTPENEFDYAGWYGVKDLPEIREDENGLVEGPREHIFYIVKRWMDPNDDGNPADGIDGWRLDVAEQVNHNFWKLFRTWVKEINPNAYIVGEIWWDDWNNYKMMNASPWIQGDQFDAVMNYRFARAIKNFVINKKDRITPQGFIDSLNTLYKQYPFEGNYVMMNLLDSHDVERISSMVVNPDLLYDHNGNGQNKDFDVRKPNDGERQKQKLAVAIQFSLPGAPQIYYGDESGMWGGDDPDCRKPMVWKEFKYETETTHPFGLPRPTDEVIFDKSLFDWYKKLAHIRNENEELSLGKVSFNVIDNEKSIICYTRKYNENSIVILANNNESTNEINLDSVKGLSGKNNWKDLVSGNSLQIKDGVIKLSPYQIIILK